MSKYSQYLEFAIDIAKKAGKIQLSYFGKISSLQTKSSNIDLVTNADIESEHFILDQLSIKFVGVDIFSGQYTIDPEGYINLPEVHKIFVEGMTVKELSDDLNKRFKSFIINPVLMISINGYRPVDSHHSCSACLSARQAHPLQGVAEVQRGRLARAGEQGRRDQGAEALG